MGLVAVLDTWNSDHFKYNIMKERQVSEYACVYLHNFFIIIIISTQCRMIFATTMLDMITEESVARKSLCFAFKRT